MRETYDAVAHLERIRELLSEPARWTQGVAARRADGTPCRYGVGEPVSWCLTGAYEHTCPERINGDAHLDAGHYLRDAIAQQPGRDCQMVPWNDAPKRKHAEVLAVIDLAANLACGSN